MIGRLGIGRKLAAWAAKAADENLVTKVGVEKAGFVCYPGSTDKDAWFDAIDVKLQELATKHGAEVRTTYTYASQGDCRLATIGPIESVHRVAEALADGLLWTDEKLRVIVMERSAVEADPAEKPLAIRDQPRRTIDAVSGKTGKQIWQYELDDRWFDLPQGVEIPLASRWFAAPLLGSTSGFDWIAPHGKVFRNYVYRISGDGEQIFRQSPLLLIQAAEQHVDSPMLTHHTSVCNPVANLTTTFSNQHRIHAYDPPCLVERLIH